VRKDIQLLKYTMLIVESNVQNTKINVSKPAVGDINLEKRKKQSK
jgi:hypothetical protein